jgi:hypothetical protein
MATRIIVFCENYCAVLSFRAAFSCGVVRVYSVDRDE